MAPPDFVELWDILLTYEGDHDWHIKLFLPSLQMSLWWDDRPVYIFKEFK